MASIPAVEDNFLVHVKEVKSEMRDKFPKAHKVLQDKEADLLAKLQKLEDEFNEDEITKQIVQLNLSKDALTNTLTGNENKDILDQNLANIDTRIDVLKQKLHTAKDTYKSVTLKWDAELVDKLSLIGDILLNSVTQEKARDYKQIDMPVFTFGKHSSSKSSPGVFASPKGLAMDPITNYLYICDDGNDRVQVFNKSLEFLFIFSDKMKGPDFICIKHNKVYVTQFRANLLTVYSTDGKYLQSVGGEGNDNLEFDGPSGLDISNELDRIYIAEHGNDRIQSLNLDLSFHSIIDDIYGSKDVQLTPKEIVVLSARNPCISLYSYTHQLIREMIPHGKTYHLISSYAFVVDESFNILITGADSHCVCVYSHRGEFLHKFGKEGNQEGEFIEPHGITICPQGRIIVSSENRNHSIQLF